MKKYFLTVIFVALFFVFCPLSSNAKTDIDTPAWQEVEELGEKGAYTFLFFTDNKTEAGEIMMEILWEVKQEVNREEKDDVEGDTVNETEHHLRRADIVEVALNNPEEQKLMEFFNIKGDPIVVVIAPNGAITGYFGNTVDKQSLMNTIVSLKEAELFKNLQDGLAVFLCFYKDKEPKLAAIKAILKSVADNFKGTLSVVYARTNDEKEKDLRKKLMMSSETTMVFVFVPPGRLVDKLEGADITKTNLMKALYAPRKSSCGSGRTCAPGSSKTCK